MTPCPKPADLFDQLRAFELFTDVDDNAVRWLIKQSEFYCLQKDEIFFKAGDKIDHMHILLTGAYLISRADGNKKREMGLWEAPYVAGILPFSRMKEANAEGKATEESTILQLHKNCFTEMVNVSYTLTQALVSVMTERVRDFQQMRLMDEKLMALGKMSAGLAHELNNPASAMVRSSQELHKHLSQTPERFKALVTMRTTPEDVDGLNEVLFSRISKRKDEDDLSLLDREERYDDLEDWFEAHEINDFDDVSDTLLDWNFTVGELEAIANFIPAEALKTVLWWIETSLTTESLVDEIQTASGRIAELVTSIKSYSHMDSDPSMEFIDLHKGIKSTLTMLKFKFKKKRIKLSRDIDTTLPNIKALEGELNQVWTNLMSNALDALPEDGTGEFTIRTYRRRDNLCIEFEDNGPGVPENIKSRIFEPFFTTKSIGEGTGMGLDIVRRVLKRHGGTVALDSAPGKTCFRVCFPL